LPYQFLLSISALRAVFREFKGANDWEKTAHSGVHRAPTEPKTFRGGARPAGATNAVVKAAATRSGAATNGAGAEEDTVINVAVGRRAASADATVKNVAVASGRQEGAKAASVPAGSFDALFDEAEARLGAGRGSVLVLDPERKTFSVKAGRGLPEGVAGSAVFGAGEGVAGWAVRNKSRLIIAGQQGPDELRERLNQPDLVSSSIVVPVTKNGDTVAVVSLSSKEKMLRREDLDWLGERAGELIKREPEALSA
jgi:hypothetical protein